MPAKTPVSIYQIKITLVGTKPPIWRRVQVPSTMTLHRLHSVIQIAMGWYDSHLYEFIVGNTHYGDDEYADDGEQRAATASLDRVAPAVGAALTYIYDFGDYWAHRIRVEKILPPDPTFHYPRCTGGRLACPPEDVGGIPGYYMFLEAIQDPEHPEHENLLDWAGGEFDPRDFDPADANARFGQLDL